MTNPCLESSLPPCLKSRKTNESQTKRDRSAANSSQEKSPVDIKNSVQLGDCSAFVPHSGLRLDEHTRTRNVGPPG
ncbi:hypothetical protein PGTUg99_022781 [Puccinia graminis f. sp. tritici]|uniref:Uncharacterized protein n=1 Tax=Puccinia graminis f. sp. tritici TaxID=56615 RepID=A0A5B0S547_PUCGR|nr:hypothetical protein PGTUg99_022781 [Puccinia graminis f. sp. tritici]